MADSMKGNGNGNGQQQFNFQLSENDNEDPFKSQEPIPSFPLPPTEMPSSSEPPRRLQRLSDKDLTSIRLSLGAPLTLPSLLTGEPLSPPPTASHSRIWHILWPPHNLPPGLYKTVLTNRHKSQVSYYLTSTLNNTCLILQLLLGATITALSSSSISAPNASAKSTAITILAAANTVNAGLVALLHNSGLPSRLRNDWNEYEKVEMHLLELCMSGVVPQHQTVEEAIDSAFRRYGVAKETVRGNKPAVYAGVDRVRVAGVGGNNSGGIGNGNGFAVRN